MPFGYVGMPLIRVVLGMLGIFPFVMAVSRKSVQALGIVPGSTGTPGSVLGYLSCQALR